MQPALTLPHTQTCLNSATDTHAQYLPLIACSVYTHTHTHKHWLSTQCIILVLRERTGGYWDSPHASSRSSCGFSASLPSLLVLFSLSPLFLSLFLSPFPLTSLSIDHSLFLLHFITSPFVPILAFRHLLYRCYLLDDWLHLCGCCVQLQLLC